MKKLFVSVLLSLLLYTPALALERFDIVTTQELSELLSERQEGKIDFLLVNTLDQLIANHQSIPGSINIPWGMAGESSKKLGNDQDKLIITYCMGYR